MCDVYLLCKYYMDWFRGKDILFFFIRWTGHIHLCTPYELCCIYASDSKVLVLRSLWFSSIPYARAFIMSYSVMLRCRVWKDMTNWPIKLEQYTHYYNCYFVFEWDVCMWAQFQNASVIDTSALKSSQENTCLEIFYPMELQHCSLQGQ